MWQLLRADRASRAAHRAQHGAAAAVHYSTAAAAAAAPDGSRSFCLSRGKLSLQQLNRRLAAYLQQVRCLEAANQRLEHQIQEELDRKCPTERRQLDGYLKATSLLQKQASSDTEHSQDTKQPQISDGQSAQAQMKLQLLSAELTVCDFSLRCEKERERRGCLEAELSDLRVLEEVLKEHTLPELRAVLSDQQQQLLELQTQNHQDRQGLLARLSGASLVEVQTAASSDLIQQLDDLRQTSAAPLYDHNDMQVSMLGPAQVTFAPAAGSEVVQTELQELRRTAASLEEELTHLQAQSLGVEASGLERAQVFVQQLAALQRRADGVCGDLDSVLRAAARQAEDHDILLDIKGRLETEILDYRRLLDGLSHQGVPGLPSAVNVPSSPSPFRRNSTVNKKLNVQGGSLRMMGVQTVSRGHNHTARQAPLVAPEPSAKATVQTIRVQSKPPQSSPVRSINTSNLTGSFHRAGNQRTGSLSGRTGRETMTTQQSDAVEGKDPQFVSAQISHSLDRKSEINAAQAVTTLVPDAQTAGSPALQAEPETCTTNQATTGAGWLTATTKTHIQTEITKTVLSAETEVKPESDLPTKASTPDSSREAAAEEEKELESSSERPAETSSAQINSTEGSFQATNQEVVSLSPEIHAEAVGHVWEDVTASIVSGLHVPRSEEAAVQESTPEIKTAQGINTLVSDTQTDISTAQEKTEDSASTETPAEHDSLADEKGTCMETEISKTHLYAEPEVKEGSHLEMNMITPEPSRGTAAEEKKELESSSERPAETSSAQINSTEGSFQATNQEVVSLSSVIHEKAVGHAWDVVATPTPEITTAQSINTLVSDTQTAISTAQAKPEDSEVKEGSHLEMNMTTTEPSRETDAEEKKETDEVISAPADEDQDPAEAEPLVWDSVRDAEEVSVSEPAEAESNISAESTLIDDKGPKTEESKGEEEESKGEEEEGEVLDASNSEEMKVIEDAVTGSGPEVMKEVEAETKERSATNSFHDAAEIKADLTELDKEMVHLEPPSSPTKPNKSVSLTDSGVALTSSDHEEVLSPGKEHVFMGPAEPFSCVSPVEAEVLMSMTDKAFRPVDEEERVTSPDSLFSPNDPEMLLSPNDLDSCLSPGEAPGCLSPSGEEEEACLSLTEAISLVRPVEKYVLSTKEEAQSLSFGRDQGLPGEEGNREVSISVKDGDGLCFGSFESNEASRDALNVTAIHKPTSRGVGLRLGGAGGSESGAPVGRSIIADKEKQLGFGGLYRKIGRDPGVGYDFKNRKENSNKPFVKSASFESGASSQSDLVTSFGSTAGNSSGAVSGAAEATGRFRRGSGNWMVYGGSPGQISTTLPSKGGEESPTGAASRPETGRFGSRGSGEWAVYGGSLGRKSSLTRTGSEESPSVSRQPATSPADSGRFSTGGQVVYSSNVKRSDSLPFTSSRENQPAASYPAASPPGTGRFGSTGSGEWRFYGGTSGRMSGVAGGECPPSADGEESPQVAKQLATSPPGTGRFSSTGSGEWRVYGGSTGRLSRDGSMERGSAAKNRVISPPSSYTGSVPRLSGSVVRRSSSVGSGGRLSGSGSGSKLSSSSGGASSTGRFSSGGSGEGKPVYSSASGRRSSAGSAGRPAGGGATSSHRAPSPGGRVSAGSGGWLSALTAGASRISGSGSGSKVSGGSGDRISGQAGGRMSSSSGSGRGGRVISSSDRPIRSTGSGAGANKERISVCKMAALSISAAGRERSQDRRRRQQQQQAAASSPLVQQWLTTGVGVTSADPDGLDDIMRL